MKKTFLILVMCLFASLKSFSQDWQFIGKGEISNGLECEMYMKPVVYDVKNGVKKAWFKNVIPKILYVVDGVTYEVKNGFTLNLINAKCNDRKIFTSTICYYDSEGRLVHQENLQLNPNVFEDVVPDTAGEFYFGLICK